MYLVLSGSCLYLIHLSQVLSRDGRCSWSSPTGDAPTTSEWQNILLPTKVRLILEVWQYFSKRTHIAWQTFYIKIVVLVINYHISNTTAHWKHHSLPLSHQNVDGWKGLALTFFKIGSLSCWYILYTTSSQIKPHYTQITTGTLWSLLLMTILARHNIKCIYTIIWRLLYKSWHDKQNR